MSAPPTLSAKALDAPLRAQIAGELVAVVATLAHAQLDSFTTRLAQALQDAGQRNADPALNKLYANAAACNSCRSTVRTRSAVTKENG
jgi:hypothetical protein